MRGSSDPPRGGSAVRTFVKIDAPVVVLTSARVVDGTGAPAKPRQTLVLRGGKIAALGDGSSGAVPDGATVVDLAGKTVIPGLVHGARAPVLPDGPQVYGQL